MRPNRLPRRPPARLRWLFLALLAAATSACSQGGPAFGPVAPGSRGEDLTDEEETTILQATRSALEGGLDDGQRQALSGLPGSGIIVDLHERGRGPTRSASFASALSEAIEETAERLQGTRAIDRWRMGRAQLVVSIVRSITPIEDDAGETAEELSKRLVSALEPGIVGLVAELEGRSYVQLPEDVIYNGWGLEGDETVKAPALVQLRLDELGKQSCASLEQVRQQGALHTLKTSSFLELPGRFQPLLRARIPVPPLDGSALRQRALSNADYLARIVDEVDGRFNYIYYPVEDRVDQSQYNLARHIGGIFGLFEAYRVLEDEKYLSAARRALEYVLPRIRRPDDAPEIALIEEKKELPLAHNALLALMLSGLPERDATEEELELRDAVGQGLLRFVVPGDSGLFYESYDQAQRGEIPLEQPLYAPGEAMLALVRLFEATGDQRYWEAAVAVAPGQKALWEAAGPDRVGDYAWVGQAFGRMGRLEKDPAMVDYYREVGYSHADAVLLHQFEGEDGRPEDYVGAADVVRPPRSAPTGARAESVAENYLLARQLDDRAAMERFGPSLLSSLRFIYGNQYTEQNTYYLPNPERAIGGIRGGLIAEDIRIDYNRHTLGTTLNSLTIPDDLEALEKTR